MLAKQLGNIYTGSLYNGLLSLLCDPTSANTQGEYLKSVDDIINNAMVSINEIEVAEGITQDDKNTMIANTIARRDADLAFTKQLYSNMPTWDFSWIDTADGAMPAAPGVDATTTTGTP